MSVLNKELKEGNTTMLKDKYMLTIKEAAFYFNIGTKKLRRIAEDNVGNFAFVIGNRFMINRVRFENYLDRIMDGLEDGNALNDLED